MAKRTAVIDLGSNSMRMAIFERTSRWAFFILGEYKMKVRLGEGGYSNGSIISESSMQKAFNAFCEFKSIAKGYKCNKIFCVGTSALRDAPNSKELIAKVFKELGINIKVINGTDEATYGAIAAKTLLTPIKNAVTIDIGGGSTELALIKDGAIEDAVSLDIGTVRLKELFGDKEQSKSAKFIEQIVANIPKNFKSENLIAIGGSLRAISSAIMSKNSYPINTIHGFCYQLEANKNFIESIANSTIDELENFAIKKDRFDTIREGASIFLAIAKQIGAKSIHTSGVGVREGVFLSDFLRKSSKNSLANSIASLPKGLNISLKSLQDRFCLSSNKSVTRYAKDIYEILLPLHKLDGKYKSELLDASRIYNIGVDIGFYSDHISSAFMVLNGLNFGFTHEQKTLIANIIATNGKKVVYEYEKYKNLLPKQDIIRWLSFILALARLLNVSKAEAKLAFELKNHTLYISGAKQLNMAKEEIKKLSKPDTFAISFI
ncbi:Ppx/GppA phosphatase family protein [Campylobacter mucosalis]|uniref:Ppx/GppA phosphatase family protein n=1 Tax=Campylobacter mucosalis TaxID=202 RepID=UPI00146FFD64|nr:Ppx/GppA phosphatase family protein [Campylobacter mucosalis]